MRPLPAYTFEDPAVMSRSAYRSDFYQADCGSLGRGSPLWAAALERVECPVEVSTEDVVWSIQESI